MEDQKDKERGKEKKRSEQERGLGTLKNYFHSYTTVVPLCNKLLTVYRWLYGPLHFQRILSQDIENLPTTQEQELKSIHYKV